MLTKPERCLLIQMMSNLDDVLGEMTTEQRNRISASAKRIRLNYCNLLEGVPDDAKDEGDKEDQVL